MRILIEIEEDKQDFFMELLESFSFVEKVIILFDTKDELSMDINEAIDELKLIREGKLEARDAEDLIDKL